MSRARHTISLPPDVAEMATKRMKLFGYDKFSHYIEQLIRADYASRSDTLERSRVAYGSGQRTQAAAGGERDERQPPSPRKPARGSD